MIVFINLVSISIISRHGTASCQAEGTCVSRYNLKLSLRKIVSKAVILILAVIKELGAVKAEHLVEYRKVKCADIFTKLH